MAQTQPRLMAMIASQRSIGNSRTGAVCWMPALLTRISTPPRSRVACAIMSSISAGFDMSAALVGHAHAVRLGERSPHAVDLGRLAKPVQGGRRHLPPPTPRRSRGRRRLVDPVTTADRFLEQSRANGSGRRSVETETFMRSLLPVDHRHEHRGQGPTPAQQTLGPPIKGPGGNAERHGKEDRVQERHQDQTQPTTRISSSARPSAFSTYDVSWEEADPSQACSTSCESMERTTPFRTLPSALRCRCCA